MCDQKEHANTEGEVQMGTTRADGCRRLDEEAWRTALRCCDCYEIESFQSWMKIKSWR